MGKADSLTKQYMQDTAVFADAFNYLIYGGEAVIKPEQLRELDTAALAELYGADGKSSQVQVYRDLLNCVTAMEDGSAAYLILGVENQTSVHYAMPVRNWLYDALQYYRQVQDTTKKNRKEEQKATREEFLSGFRREDKLLPVITLVVYFGTKPWDGPTSLHEMLTVSDSRLLACTAEYKLNLLDPSAMADADIEKLKTDLQNVCYYIKYAKDKEKLQKLMDLDESFRHLKRATAEMLNTVTNSTLTLPEGEEEIDMCKAIQDIREESIAIGEARGESRGIAIGEARGESRGIAIGEARGKFEVLLGLVKDGILTAAAAAERIGLTEAQFMERMAQLQL